MDFGAQFAPGEFDAVLFADVLEHLRNPDDVLRRIIPHLAPGGVIIASVPNVRNALVLQMLGAGDWTYQEAGLLDKTHLRFFTRREVQRLFSRSGLRIDLMSYVFDNNHGAWLAQGRPTNVGLGPIALQAITPEDAEELFVYQFLVRAEVAPPPPFEERARPLVSIVIPVRGQRELTAACLQSIRRSTPQPWEVVIVDNGSDDDTPAWAAEQRDIRYIRNKENRGFGAACNQGMAAAKGDFVVLLNNDTIVPAGWIDALLAPMVRDSAVGITGPRSNWVSGVQLCPEARYGDDMTAMERFAADWQLRHRATGVPVPRLVGFCMAIRREVIAKIGGMDERFGIGNFEDDDYCIRAMIADYYCWLANDAFVHHWGHRTFTAHNEDFNAILERNWRTFAAKWELPEAEQHVRGYNLERLLETPFDPKHHKISLRGRA
jgi:GT2 family glycosyltransferase